MVVIIGIPFILLAAALLYHSLTKWMERRDAGTFATFIMLAGSCCIFSWTFLPLEFSHAVRFFGVLAVLAIPLLGVKRKTKPREPQSFLEEEQETCAEFFDKGDADL
jgi:hypothetical protein